MKKSLIFLILFSLFTSCDTSNFVVNDVDEREANEIIVFLASKGIKADKTPSLESATAAATGPSNMWSIAVSGNDQTNAMALLNQAGLPRRKGMSLLELFAKQGLMSSDREENIRFQAGLAEELKTTIRKIDGVIDADVQLSFPLEDPTAEAGAPTAPTEKKITAAVYIKHVGIFDDPNNQLETKIKRFLAGSVQGLDFDHVSVIADRAKIADITLTPDIEVLSAADRDNGYVSIWSIVMTKASASRFRMILILMMLFIIFLGSGFLWMFFTNYQKFTKTALEKMRLKKTKKADEEDQKN